MKFAIPTANGKLCQHFGHCEMFTFVEVNEETKEIIATEKIIPPPHQPGILPPWVAEQGAGIILTGGMGNRAQQLFVQQGVKVIAGCPSKSPEKIVIDYLNGILETGVNSCTHNHCGNH